MRPRSRGAALLLTVLVVLSAATITAVLVQVAVQAAGGQKRQLAHELALEEARVIERRVANALAQDPLQVFSEVLPDEVPRVCSADPTGQPSALSSGSEWPASCGALWTYSGTGGLAKGARVFPPSPSSPLWRVEVFARVGSEQVGFTRTFVVGGRDRPMLYSGDDLTAGSFDATLTINGPVYAVGDLDLTSATLGDGVPALSESSVTGAAAGLTAQPGASSGTDIRDVVGSPLPSSTMVSSLGELNRVGCLDPSPSRVLLDGEMRASSLCLRAGSSLVDAAGASLTFPAEGTYGAVLLVPIDAGRIRVYTHPSTPSAWPGLLTEWSDLGVFPLPQHGIVVTDAPTVLGHCDESAGTCRSWSDDALPGAIFDSSFTLVVGSASSPADLYVGGPLRAGSTRAAALVSGVVRFPVAATPEGAPLTVDLWMAALGRPGTPSLVSSGTGSRPLLELEGALLLNEFTADLSGFSSVSVLIPSEGVLAPPFFPSPGLLARPDYGTRTSSSDLGALFAEGEASGLSVPGAPSLLSVTPSDRRATLLWSAPLDDGGANVTDYVIEYRTSGATSWSTFTDPVSTSLTASVPGLENALEYEFRVAAVNGVGTGPYSGVIAATPYLAPAAPTGLLVAGLGESDPASQTALSLSWSPVTNVTVSGYNVYRQNQLSGLYEVVASPLDPTHLDTGLTPGVTYSYKISAFTTLGEGDLSAAVSASTTNLAPPTPTLTSTTRGNLTVTLSFTVDASTDRPVEGFRFSVDGVEVATSSDPALSTYTFTGLTSGVSSTFGVASFNADGTSPAATSTVTVIETPDTPTGVSVAPESDVPLSLEVTWSAPSNIVPDGFYVYRENDVTGVYEVIATVTGGPYFDGPLDAGISYSYRVSAFVADLEGGLSVAVSSVAIDVPLDAVILGSSLGDLSVTIDFVVDSSAGNPLDGYLVFLDGVEVDTLSPLTGSYEFTGLLDGATYEVSVLGFNAAGQGVSDALLITANALPAQVTGLTVTPTSGSETSLELAWDEPAASVTGFYVYRENALNGIFEVVSTVAVTGYTDTSLLPGTSYTYRVTAYGPAGEGPVSTSVSGATYAVSSSPTALSVSAGSGEASLSWSAPLDDGGYALTGYELEYATTESFIPATVVNVEPSATSTTVTGLTNGLTYWFRLAASNPGGRSTFTSSVSATPLAAAPALATPTNASDDLVYCRFTTDCSGLSPSVSAAETWRLAFTAQASGLYQVQAMAATTGADADSWFGSSTELNATFSVSGAGSSVSGSTGQVTISTSTSGTVTVDATGTDLRDRPVFFKVTKVNAPVASGGTPSSSAAYTDVLAVYTTAQTTSLVAPGNGTVDFLVIGGGGSGGHGYSAAFGGSGGAGGYRTSAGTSGGGAAAESELTLTRGTSYTVTVGSGGQAPTTSVGVRGSSGGNSVFATVTSTGGGAGSGTNSGQSALSGGSGGGGSYETNTSGASGTAGQGYAGGNYNTGGQAGLGGGAGSAATLTTPGSGAASLITGTSVTRAAGGSGAGATAPAANTGSGGSGGRPVASAGPVAASGGSGIVIVRYQR